MSRSINQYHTRKRIGREKGELQQLKGFGKIMKAVNKVVKKSK